MGPEHTSWRATVGGREIGRDVSKRDDETQEAFMERRQMAQAEFDAECDAAELAG